ncbi:hypothetical protein Dsin_017461 [Dipteronia sinensis]|uniref:Uncharacterized protein n=1 Tax=Dipteronia sinensis TaxID=43782 RepID=A0AAE0AGG0_9ROSI|nr:hypothetical protein Dsin_017461 [Dipteronia sinensis]
MRVRVRRKRKKQNHQRVKSELTHRVLRFFIKYWMVLNFLIAAGLLLFEATRTGKKPSSVDNSEHSGVTQPRKEKDLRLVGLEKPSLEKKPEGNLNRL